MNGMILAAGEGKRLRPLTRYLPKPMLPLAGRPLLEHIIIHLRDCGITRLAINLHHLPEAVMGYFGAGSRWGVSLRYSVEEQLLGSAGGVKRLQPFFDDTFLLYYGDVYTQADLRPMIEFHRRSGAAATMGLYRVPDPWNRGIVQLDDAGTIVKFVEKPPREQVFSDLANAGIYVLEPEVLDMIPEGRVWDFGQDVFPAMLAKDIHVAGYVIEDILIDIGLPDKYQQANRIASGVSASARVRNTLDVVGVAP